MLERLSKKSLPFIVFLLMLLNINVIFWNVPAAYAGSYPVPNKEEVIEYAAVMLEAVMTSEDSQDVYGLPNIDLTTVTLGDPIPVFEEVGGGIQSADQYYWLVYSGDTAVATVISFTDASGTLFRFTASYASKLGEVVESGEDCAIATCDDGAYLCFEEGSTQPLDVVAEAPVNTLTLVDNRTLGEKMKPYTESIGQKKDAILDDPTVRITTNTELEEMRADQVFNMQQDVVLLTISAKDTNTTPPAKVKSSKKASSQIKRELPVPLVKQSGNTCWAAAVSCIGQFLTGKQLSDIEICKKLSIATSSGGNAWDAIKGLACFTYPDSNTSIYGASFTGSMSDQEIKNWINNGMPIWASLRYAKTDSYHAVTVCGWGEDANQKLFVRVVDPGNGKKDILTKNGSGIFQFSYGKRTFKWNSGTVRLVKWQKPYKANGWCYFYSSGRRATGWLRDGSEWYYLNSSGIMQTGWKKISSKWYYLGSSGAMHVGWLYDREKWYYLGEDGAAVSGWKKIGKYWYMFDSSCAMRKGWYKENGKWYYLRTAKNAPSGGPEGSMLASGKWKINGKQYSFNAKGECTNKK